MAGHRRKPKIYAMLRKRYTTQALRLMGFQFDSVGRFVKLGVCRSVLAEASSLDCETWRVRPTVRQWK